MKQTMDKSIKDDLDAHGDQESSAENRGGDHRPSQDNGTQGHTSYKMGDPSGNSFPDAGKPIEERWTPGESPHNEGQGAGDLEIDDFGLDPSEKTQVGTNQSIANYGIEGPAAGGGLDRNTKGTTGA